MFKSIKIKTDIYIYYYKYFLLNKYWIDYLNDKITYDNYYKYNTFYMEQIKLYNNINDYSNKPPIT